MNEHATTEWSSDALSPASAATPDAQAAPQAAPESAAPDVSTPRQRPTRPPRGVRRLTGHRGGASASGAPEASDASEASDDELTSTRKRKRVSRKTDSGLIPALRLNHYVGRKYAARKPAAVYDTEYVPRRLRLTRLLMGVMLLGVAWAAALLVAELTESLMDVFPNQPSLTIRFGLYILGAIGLAWLAVVALALIVVGAFSLTLALTRRQW